MPRQARIIPLQGVLHVMCRGNNHRKLFLYPRDLKAYYLLLSRLKKEESIKVFHYCLMSNHVHLLLEVKEESNLSRFMKRLNLKYFYYYRKRRNYSGHLWQDRFKSKVIEKDEYLIQCGKYIELNPVRAGIVKVPEDYPFSSYLHYGWGKEDKLLDDDPLYMNMGENPTARQLAYRNMLIKEIVYKRL